MVNFLSFLFAIGLGFGLSCWICGTLLEKSNNIGDSRGENRDYDAYVQFTTRKDRLTNKEKGTFPSMYSIRIDDASTGPSGSEQVRRLSKEELEKYKHIEESHAAAEKARSYATVADNEAEFARWEKQNQAGSLNGIFKPLDQN